MSKSWTAVPDEIDDQLVLLGDDPCARSPRGGGVSA